MICPGRGRWLVLWLLADSPGEVGEVSLAGGPAACVVGPGKLAVGMVHVVGAETSGFDAAGLAAGASEAVNAWLSQVGASDAEGVGRHGSASVARSGLVTRPNRKPQSPATSTKTPGSAA